MLLCYTPGDVVAEQFLNLNLTNNLTGNNSDFELQFSIFSFFCYLYHYPGNLCNVNDGLGIVVQTYY